jgi:hypothetical protein
MSLKIFPSKRAGSLVLGGFFVVVVLVWFFGFFDSFKGI